jgi:hypothetical protein
VRDLINVRQRPAFRSILSADDGKVAANAREVAIVRMAASITAASR